MTVVFSKTGHSMDLNIGLHSMKYS